MHRQNQITHLRTIDSTNAYALRELDRCADKHIITAATQTRGRGRFNRAWVSDIPANLYLSIVLKPDLSGRQLEQLTAVSQLMALAIVRTLQTYKLTAELKWPNDVLVNRKKISGILAQTSLQEDTLRGYILGVGVNLNFTAEQAAAIDQPATALNIETGRPTDLHTFQDKLLDTFFADYPAVLEQGFTGIREEYTAACSFLGKNITVNFPDRQLAGTAEGYTDEGALLLMTTDGEQVVTAGDIII